MLQIQYHLSSWNMNTVLALVVLFVACGRSKFQQCICARNNPYFNQQLLAHSSRTRNQLIHFHSILTEIFESCFTQEATETIRYNWASETLVRFVTVLSSAPDLQESWFMDGWKTMAQISTHKHHRNCWTYTTLMFCSSTGQKALALLTTQPLSTGSI